MDCRVPAHADGARHQAPDERGESLTRNPLFFDQGRPGGAEALFNRIGKVFKYPPHRRVEICGYDAPGEGEPAGELMAQGDEIGSTSDLPGYEVLTLRISG